MTRKKAVIAAGILAGIVIIVVICFNIFQQSKSSLLVGKWEGINGWGSKTVYEFFDDGTMKIGVSNGIYTMDWDTMNLTMGPNENFLLDYIIDVSDNDTLVLKDSFTKETLTRIK